VADLGLMCVTQLILDVAKGLLRVMVEAGLVPDRKILVEAVVGRQ
jgi:hypothetical protein